MCVEKGQFGPQEPALSSVSIEISPPFSPEKCPQTGGFAPEQLGLARLGKGFLAVSVQLAKQPSHKKAKGKIFLGWVVV